MNWYLTKLVYRIICGDGDHTPQFEEQLRIIIAENKENAFKKAVDIGKQEEDNFLNHKDKPVQWKFINVCELYRLSDVIDGAEIYSRIEETEFADNYINMINSKADRILFSNTLDFFELA